MPMSDEAKKRIGDATRARYAAKKAQMDDSVHEPAPVAPTKAEGPTVQEESTMSGTEREDLQRQIDELKVLLQNSAARLTQGTPGVQVNPQGKLTGTHDKYIIDPKNYPDPTPRLSREPRLQRFAFPINYELEWDVSTTSYQTQDGVNTREPKFTLKLNKVKLDDEGEPTVGRYTLRTATFHEDPQAAIVVARDNGLEIDDYNEKDFLDEMRYLRMRAWLLEAFYPPKTEVKKNAREEVIGNQVVQYFEVTTPASGTLSFDQLKNPM